MTPSSSTASSVSRSEKTWKPPESVRIGPSQPENACKPPCSETMSSPGSEVQVVGVGEDHVGAHGPHLVGMQALDGRLGADGHERRGRDLAVRRPHDPGPGSPVGRVAG